MGTAYSESGRFRILHVATITQEIDKATKKPVATHHLSVHMVDTSQQKDRLITISYAPLGQESQSHRVFIPWTDDYNKALELASNKLKRLFPEGTDNEFRWLALKVEGESTWTELDADVFPAIAKELKNKAELRLDESRKLKTDVTILPLGRDEDVYYQFKIIVIGPTCVGKTMYISSRFISSDGTLLKAALWDTVGQERYRALTQSIYRNVNGVLLVYNLTKKGTFEACEGWREELKEKVANFDQVKVVLVGNQLDLEGQRDVSKEEAQAYADRHGFEFAEVSAKEGTKALWTNLSARNELEQYKKSRNQQRREELEERAAPPQGNGCKC
ncbi:unnamed protein product [Rhizoctonia solani]|uniref:Uncharacterized protein n=1 Tax=Rhizoctonia solani TaxID=456999 RepID=A0A8H3CJG3_9AGAM|nr:unnamed protein product [Rhizoctonia solani]